MELKEGKSFYAAAFGSGNGTNADLVIKPGKQLFPVGTNVQRTMADPSIKKQVR
jgi:hypothetical protein